MQKFQTETTLKNYNFTAYMIKTIIMNSRFPLFQNVNLHFAHLPFERSNKFAESI